MSLYNSLDRGKHLSEFDDPLVTNEGTLTPATRKARALANLGLDATAAEINRVADVSARLVNAGATLSLTESAHDGATVVMDQAAGSVLTLPASSGSGAKFRVVVGTTVTSNDHIVQVASASDVMAGTIFTAADGGDTVLAWEAAADSDTITMNGTTKGGIRGNVIDLQDIASGVWLVTGHTSGTGTEVTPFSAAVS